MATNFVDKMAEKRHCLVGRGGGGKEGSVRAAIIARIIGMLYNNGQVIQK